MLCVFLEIHRFSLYNQCAQDMHPKKLCLLKTDCVPEIFWLCTWCNLFLLATLDLMICSLSHSLCRLPTLLQLSLSRDGGDNLFPTSASPIVQQSHVLYRRRCQSQTLSVAHLVACWLKILVFQRLQVLYLLLRLLPCLFLSLLPCFLLRLS